ncbi:MAG: hypothetical protein HOM34_05370 [Planctomycetes bacterium]|nr:hypothetical protein [Planctomycetota bacterium]
MTHHRLLTFASICLFSMTSLACSGGDAEPLRAIDHLESTTVARGALENAGSIQVKVIDVGGQPWAGAVVKVKGYFGLRLEAMTDEAGLALFEKVGKGPTRVMVMENEIRMAQEFLQVRPDVLHEVILHRPVVTTESPEVDASEKRPVE